MECGGAAGGLDSPGEVTAEQLAPQAQRAQRVRGKRGSEAARVTAGLVPQPDDRGYGRKENEGGDGSHRRPIL